MRGEEPRKLGLCVLCGLPASGKSTFARALGHRLRQELGWAVGVVAYDDVLPDAFPEEEGARPLVSAVRKGRGLVKDTSHALLGGEIPPRDWRPS